MSKESFYELYMTPQDNLSPNLEHLSKWNFCFQKKNDTTCGKYSVAGRTFQWQQIAVLGRKISQASNAQKFRFLRLMLAYIEPWGHVLARGAGAVLHVMTSWFR